MNQNIQKRKFKGVWIPREIWLSNDLSITEKCLLTEIDSLDNENGCTASNRYFAEFFTVSPRQISKYITRLEEKGMIKVMLIGRNRRKILMELKFRPDRTKVPSADGTKVPHSNTVVNNTVNSPPDKPADWNPTSETMKLTTDPKRYIQIIGVWLIENALRPENKDQMQSLIKRNVRVAKLLEGYQNEDIAETIRTLKNTQYLAKFTLETVSKYIDEIVAQKKKQGPKILRWEEVKGLSGQISMRPIYA